MKCLGKYAIVWLVGLMFLLPSVAMARSSGSHSSSHSTSHVATHTTTSATKRYSGGYRATGTGTEYNASYSSSESSNGFSWVSLGFFGISSFLVWKLTRNNR